jgi:hypothetical protein
MSRPDPTTRIIPPCKDCADRHTACHDRCDKFKEYKEMREKENEARRKYNFESAIFSKIT